MNIRNMVHAFLALVALLSLAIIALGQGSTQLNGTVTDNTGAVVIGAQVVLRNTATGVALTTKANERGIYTFLSLQPGPYELTFEMQGFKKHIRGGLVLETGTSRTVDVALEVGAVTESLQVTASTPLLDTESSSVSQFIERTTVANMPVESRRVAALMRLMGGVVYQREQQGEAIPYFAMSGGRGGNQMWNLDGAAVQNMTLGVPILTLNPPIESLQEFKADANNFAAEFGRAGGGLIQMTTRSGTNQYHGAVYEFLRNNSLDARTFFATRKAPLRYNIFGGSIGGPIRKDKTFFFGNFEGARRRDGQTFAGNLVPHPAEVKGDFSARRDLSVLDPLTRQPFPGNAIPANRLDPVGSALAAFYPAPNISNNDITRAPVNNFLANVSDRLSQNSITARLDHLWNDNNRIAARFTYIVSYTTSQNVFPTAAADFRAQLQDNDNTSIVGSWVRNLRPNLINDLRLNYGLRSNVVEAAGNGSNYNEKLKLAGVDQTMFPRINVTGLTSLGSGSHERLQLPIKTEQILDTMTWLKGKHQIKTGFEFRYSLNDDINRPSAGGAFSFGNRATNSGTAELLLGTVNSAAASQTDRITSRSDFWGTFVQDDWKVSQRLTLNFGVRWDLDTPRWEAHNRQSGFDGVKINPVAGVPGVITFSGQDGLGKYSHDMDKNNFGPRFGFAWRPIERTVVRGGYGIAYNGAYVVAVPFLLAVGFGDNREFVSPDGGFTPAFLLKSGMPAVTREALGPGFGAVPLGTSPRTTPQFIQKNQVSGYAQQFNLTVQREVRANLLVELAYMGNIGRKLGGTNVDINVVPLVDGKGPALQNQRARKFPQFSGVQWVSPVWGDSTYHALNVKVEKRYAGGLNFLSVFTWSKFIDNVTESELGGTPSVYQHMELHKFDRSISGNDIPMRWVSSGVYELPWGKGRRWGLTNPVANAVLGGWGVGAILELRDGPPWGAVEQTNTTNAFSNSQRPNLLRDPVLDAGRSRGDIVARYFDTTAFAAPGTSNFGNAARNVAYGPGFVGIDTSVHKRWHFSETVNFQFRGDFFNMPNRPNFALPATIRGRADFGTISNILAASTGRQIQLSMRLEF